MYMYFFSLNQFVVVEKTQMQEERRQVPDANKLYQLQQRLEIKYKRVNNEVRKTTTLALWEIIRDICRGRESQKDKPVCCLVIFTSDNKMEQRTDSLK